jgi:hypothetical protein
MRMIRALDSLQLMRQMNVCSRNRTKRRLRKRRNSLGSAKGKLEKMRMMSEISSQTLKSKLYLKKRLGKIVMTSPWTARTWQKLVH